MAPICSLPLPTAQIRMTPTARFTAIALVAGAILAQASERSRSRHHHSRSRVNDESVAFDDLDSQYSDMSLDEREDEMYDNSGAGYGDVFNDAESDESPRFLEMTGLLDASDSVMNPPPAHQKHSSEGSAGMPRFREIRANNDVANLLNDALASEAGTLELLDDSKTGAHDQSGTSSNVVSRLSMLENNVKSIIAAVQLNRKLYETLRRGSKGNATRSNSMLAFSKHMLQGRFRDSTSGTTNRSAEVAEAVATIESFEKDMDRSFALMDKDIRINGHSFKDELEVKLKQVLNRFESRTAGSA